MLNFDFLDKGLGIVFPAHFVYEFLINMFLMLYSIDQISLPGCLYFLRYIYFFYQGFLSRTMTTHRTAGEGREPFFIPLYQFHLLTNIQTFMCNFLRFWAICVLQLFVNQVATSWSLKLNLSFESSRFLYMAKKS